MVTIKTLARKINCLVFLVMLLFIKEGEKEKIDCDMKRVVIYNILT